MRRTKRDNLALDLPHQPPILPDLNKGDIVEIITGAWKGEVGVFVGKEETIIGTLLKIELDNDCSCLVSRHEVKRIKQGG